ncbi:MAG: hypothetical protein H6757_07315 [Candidatus Omnitrophica bacterium]|nr:hypothetical protein [Candidatus Omnitrophota bacterium]
MNGKILKGSLLVLSFYFVCMALAHFFSLKYPLLFVYYDVPFYAYQDKIISFSLIAYAILFYHAAHHRFLVPSVLVLAGVTVLGLASINVSEDLHRVLNPGQAAAPYWLQTGLFLLILIFLWVLYRKDEA